MSDEDYMKQALTLARRGLGRTSPNPMVGAVIVEDGRIIGKGYHHRFGGRHAEIDAMQNARGSVAGATIYITLEPCCHYGKTPPCVDVIISNKFGRVVVGVLDPNPRVNGKSIEILNQRGVATRVGVLEDECRLLNAAHFKYMTTGLPLVTVKFAQTLDGRIAAASGASQWISSAESRKLAHKLRATNDAVMVGIGTILADDPQLTVRLVRGRNPARIILDSRLRMPPGAKVVMTQKEAATIIATTFQADGDKADRLRERGCEVWLMPQDERGDIDLKALLRMMGERGISSVLAEGGSEVITALLRQGLADRLIAIIAPRIMGKGIEAVGELNIRDVGRALKLSFDRIYRMGADLVVEANVGKGESSC